jgi:hypothetical protein
MCDPMSLKSKYNRELFLANPDTGVFNRRSLNEMMTAFDTTEFETEQNTNYIVALEGDITAIHAELKVIQDDITAIWKALEPLIRPTDVPNKPEVKIVSNEDDTYTITWTNEPYLDRVTILVDGQEPVRVPVLDKTYTATIRTFGVFDAANKFVEATVILANIIGASEPGIARVNRFYYAPIIKHADRKNDNRDYGTIIYDDPPNRTEVPKGIEIVVVTDPFATESYTWLRYYDIPGSVPVSGVLANVDLREHPEALDIRLRYVYEEGGVYGRVEPNEDCSDFSNLQGFGPKDEVVVDDEMDTF